MAQNEGPADLAKLGPLAEDVRQQPDVARRVAGPVVLPDQGRPDGGPDHRLPDLVPAGRRHHRPHRPPPPDDHPRRGGRHRGDVYVGGNTAIFVDFARVLSSKLPLFIGLVVVLSFLLLAMVFRSLVIPLTAAVMNLLSIGAAFGILVAVFQWGWVGSVFQVDRTGPIEAFLPVMLFAILFGLSMDYEVFLITRIQEEWAKSGDNRTAVRNGLAATGKTITAAALIMILVFGSFILGGERVIKEFGLGLAGGILVDAVIIRMAIVPSVMFLLGKSNWWFPRLARPDPAPPLGRSRTGRSRPRRQWPTGRRWSPSRFLPEPCRPGLPGR